MHWRVEHCLYIRDKKTGLSTKLRKFYYFEDRIWHEVVRGVNLSQDKKCINLIYYCKKIKFIVDKTEKKLYNAFSREYKNLNH